MRGFMELSQACRRAEMKVPVDLVLEGRDDLDAFLGLDGGSVIQEVEAKEPTAPATEVAEPELPDLPDLPPIEPVSWRAVVKQQLVSYGIAGIACIAVWCQNRSSMQELEA